MLWHAQCRGVMPLCDGSSRWATESSSCLVDTHMVDVINVSTSLKKQFESTGSGDGV